MEVCDYHCNFDMSRPVATWEVTPRPLSEQVRFKVGKGSACVACVNDANLTSSQDQSIFTESFRGFHWGYAGFSWSPHKAPHRYPVWSDEPPSASPFHVSTTLLFGILFTLHYLGNCWKRSNLCSLYLFCSTAVLPICSHLSDRYTVTRFLYCHALGSSRVFRRCRDQVVRTSILVGGPFLLALLGFLVLGLLWNLFPWDPGVSTPPLFLNIRVWRPVSNAVGHRFGEALHPGPDVAISTLNVASLCMHQDEVLAATSQPTLRVFTETCLTQQILPTIQRKARQSKRFIVPGCICAPRSSAHKSDSQSRGESGGVLICSDLPARQGNTPMDQTTWMSTRAVEAIVSLSSELCVRVVGLYGFSKRYPGHIERTN